MNESALRPYDASIDQTDARSQNANRLASVGNLIMSPCPTKEVNSES